MPETFGLKARRANAGDADFLTDLRNTLASGFLSQMRATRQKTLLLLAGSRTYIIERKGQRLGSFALYNQHNNKAEFGRFMVVPEEQRNGLGAWALDKAFELAQAQRVNRLTLTVREDNAVASNLYTKQGFFPVRRGPGYTVMERVL